MIRGLQAVALDCPDPVRLAEFYAALLGGRVVVDPAGHPFCLCVH